MRLRFRVAVVLAAAATLVSLQALTAHASTGTANTQRARITEVAVPESATSPYAVQALPCHAAKSGLRSAFSWCDSGTYWWQHRVWAKCRSYIRTFTKYGPWVGGTSISSVSCGWPYTSVDWGVQQGPQD
jgi:hypothetical protein